MFTFTPYYGPQPKLWEVVANIMSSFWHFFNFHKGCSSVAVHSMLPDELIIGGTPCLAVVHLLFVSFHRVQPDIVTIGKVLT